AFDLESSAKNVASERIAWLDLDYFPQQVFGFAESALIVQDPAELNTCIDVGRTQRYHASIIFGRFVDLTLLEQYLRSILVCRNMIWIAGNGLSEARERLFESPFVEQQIA